MNETIDLFGNNRPDTLPGGRLCQQFMEPPFTVLDGRSGRWKSRKQEWLALGIQSEIGRTAEAYNRNKDVKAYGSLSALTDRTGTSVFDPVLCELMYKWFYPIRGASSGILDPFAGGSVRGVVAARMGLPYTGIELRQEQVTANIQQACSIPGCDPRPRWICSDARQLKNYDMQIIADDFDMLFTCPPYWNLEVYSSDPRDISNLERWGDFCFAYGDCLYSALSHLASPRFAVVVVGMIRDDKECCLRDMRIPTDMAMGRRGFRLWSELQLLTPIGSLPARAAAQFRSSRKPASAHQTVLVYYNGTNEGVQKNFEENA